MEKKVFGNAEMLEVVERAIASMMEKLKTDAVRGTVGDLIRLLQIRQELSVGQAGKITAGWVSECDQTLIDL